jgi:thiamine-phosphate diphosphorylase
MFELYVITPELAASELRSRCLRAIDGAQPGKVGLLLRTKHLPMPQTRWLAMELRAPTRDAGVALLVHTHAQLALECDADGLQIPEHGPDAQRVRTELGDRLIGRSCHDLAGLRQAATNGADLATLAPVFEVPGKNPPLGIAGFAEVARATSLPIYALGGVDSLHAAALLQAGAAGIAVTREVFAAHDPSAAVRSCLHALAQARDR